MENHLRGIPGGIPTETPRQYVRNILPEKKNSCPNSAINAEKNLTKNHWRNPGEGLWEQCAMREKLLKEILDRTPADNARKTPVEILREIM